MLDVGGTVMIEQLFPVEALAIFRQATWDANAKRSYDAMSGGFGWSDERLGDVADICIKVGNWAFRYLMGYRASLIRGTPRDELRAAWDQLQREYPDWPGFRPERASPDLAIELKHEDRRIRREFLRAERECKQRTQPDSNV